MGCVYELTGAIIGEIPQSTEATDIHLIAILTVCNITLDACRHAAPVDKDHAQTVVGHTYSAGSVALADLTVRVIALDAGPRCRQVEGRAVGEAEYVCFAVLAVQNRAN